MLHEGDTIVLAGLDGPIVTTIRALLMPEPLKEIRVKNQYRQFKTVPAANGIKIAAKELDKAIAGLKLFVPKDPKDASEIDELKEEVEEAFEEMIDSFATVDSGVHVQASTLGSMEALCTFLKEMKIPVSGLSIGPVHKKDVTRASVQLERDRKYVVASYGRCGIGFVAALYNAH